MRLVALGEIRVELSSQRGQLGIVRMLVRPRRARVEVRGLDARARDGDGQTKDGHRGGLRLCRPRGARGNQRCIQMIQSICRIVTNLIESPVLDGVNDGAAHA